MSRKNPMLAALCLLALSACATTPPPVVSFGTPLALLMQEPANPDQIPVDPSAPNSAPSGLALSDIGEAWVKDMQLVRELREHVIGLQQWIRAQIVAGQ